MNILIDGQTFETPEIHRGIGIYTKNVINNMLKQNYEHVWYIVLSDESKLDELEPWVRNKIYVIKNAAFCPGIDYDRNREYTDALEKLIEQYHIDIFWLPNMLMVNVLAPVRKLPCRVCVTVYDIIPYIFPVKEWGKTIVEEYHRRLDYLKDNKNIEALYISKATKDDFEQKIGIIEKNCVTTLAADARRFYKRRKANIEASHIILFTGGFDYRKNIDGAIEAFSRAIDLYDNDQEFAKYKLVIVGACSEEVREKYYERLRKKKLEDKVELTGYISEEELGDLYKKAEVFFFPSLYEGFGLPILEAMLGGCYIVSANNSSLPEVCNGYALMCDAGDIDGMAHILYEAYKRAATEDVKEKNERQDYALGYTWAGTAWHTLNFWESTSKELVGIGEEKDKLAIITPWPLQETGIANYVYKIVPYLQKYYQVDVYSQVQSNKCKQEENVRIYDLKDFAKNAGEYKHALYQIGNNADFHKQIYELLEKVNGVAEIHDFVLTPFFYQGYFVSGDKKKFKDLLEKGYGKEGTKAFEQCVQTLQQPDMEKFPMSHTVVKCAKKVILHNHWSAAHLEGKNIGVVPHPCFEKEEMSQTAKEELISKLKTKYHLSNELVVGCFGWVNENKRPQVVIGAIQHLLDEGKKVKLIFWGKSDIRVPNLIKKLNLQKDVYVSGYLEKEEYEAALELSDIVVNLRYPSMGESSGTLCEAFKYGKPVIVSQLNQYKEYPDEVCWKVPVCSKEEVLLTEYLEYLIENPDVRRTLGNNAGEYAEKVLNPERIAKMYYEFLEK